MSAAIPSSSSTIIRRSATRVGRHLQPAQPRHFSTSPAHAKALPFFLNTYRASGGRRSSATEHDDETNSTSVGGTTRQGKLVRMLMFGKPGAGKGTLTARLVRKYDIVPVSTGDLLRAHISERTELGREAEEIVAQGRLLPDEMVLKVVTSKLDGMQNKNWLLDGFPRTLVQGEMLDAHLKAKGSPLTLVVNLDVPDDVILSRISDRWVHLPSGRIYNMSYNRPKVEGFDDQTGEPLTKRPDDNPEIFARRLKEFYSSTSPLLAYYTRVAAMRAIPARNPHLHPHQLTFPQPVQRLKLTSVTGKTSDEIWPHLDALVRGTFPNLKEKTESTEAKRRHSLSDALLSEGLRLSATGPGK